MSSAAEPLSSGAPVVNQALEPAWVRHGSASVQKEYAIGQQFEQMLVAQLARSFTETASSEGSGEEGESGQAGSSVLTSMMPQALASGVANDGGLGLAAQLTRQLEGVAGTSTDAQAQSSLAPNSTGGVKAEDTSAE